MKKGSAPSLHAEQQTPPRGRPQSRTGGAPFARISPHARQPTARTAAPPAPWPESPGARVEPAVQRGDRVRRHGQDPARWPGYLPTRPGSRPASDRSVTNGRRARPCQRIPCTATSRGPARRDGYVLCSRSHLHSDNKPRSAVTDQVQSPRRWSPDRSQREPRTRHNRMICKPTSECSMLPSQTSIRQERPRSRTRWHAAYSAV